jgi:hypothetical protein
MDNEQHRNDGENAAAKADKEINEFFYDDKNEENTSLTNLVNTGLSSIYMKEPKEQE